MCSVLLLPGVNPIAVKNNDKCILASLRIPQSLFALVPAALNTHRHTTFHFDFLHMDSPHLIHSTSSLFFEVFFIWSYIFLMILLSIPSPHFYFYCISGVSSSSLITCPFHCSLFPSTTLPGATALAAVYLNIRLPRSLSAGAMQFPLPF
jgi:hypothetical protein